MRDVAAAAGVSVKTVSRVVNDEPGVDARTTARVGSAIRALGYRRNDAAANLRRGIPLATIGLIIEDVSNPFYATLARAVEEVAIRNDHAIVMASSAEDPQRERKVVDDMLGRGVDGLVMVPASHDHRYLLPELARGTRVVFLDRGPGGIEADSVVLDNTRGTREAIEHLIAHGHRRIAFVGDPVEVETSRERLDGYREALDAAGIGFESALVRMGPPRESLIQASTRQMLAMPDPPTAIFGQNNRNALAIIRAMRSLTGSIAFIGFDDFELADMLPVPVTVVGYETGELARAAAELLFARLAGDSRPPQRILVPTRLVVRGSGEIAPRPPRP
jgi:LacI family transcriptional regulator